MPDRWNEKLHCPKCGTNGVVSLSQEGFAIPIVESLSQGFKVVDTDLGPSFYCGACDGEAGVAVLTG